MRYLILIPMCLLLLGFDGSGSFQRIETGDIVTSDDSECLYPFIIRVADDESDLNRDSRPQLMTVTVSDTDTSVREVSGSVGSMTNIEGCIKTSTSAPGSDAYVQFYEITSIDRIFKWSDVVYECTGCWGCDNVGGTECTCDSQAIAPVFSVSFDSKIEVVVNNNGLNLYIEVDHI